MEFLKRQLFFLLCGVAGVGGIALGVTGMSKLGGVKSQMEQATKLHSDLSAMRGGAVNEKFIEVEQARIALQMKGFEELLTKVKELQPYKPLKESFFPAPPKDADEREARIDFRARYQEAHPMLRSRLNAGTAATTVEVQTAAEQIALEKRQARDLTKGETEKEAPPYTPAGVLTQTGAKEDANARANIEKAQTLYCYAAPNDSPVPAFEFNPKLSEKTRLKSDFTLADCWDAQLELWIQQDIVEAIARVNGAAAEELKSKGQTPWVGVLPVKDIISLRTARDFVGMTKEKGPEGAGHRPASPTGEGEARVVNSTEVSFRGRASEADSTFDVLQFTLKVVVDQRDLPKLIREISANRFHTLLRCAYVAIPPDPSMQGKIYGADPVVRAVLDFETHLLADEYRRLMPDEVLEQYGYDRPGGGGSEEKGEG